MIKNFLNLEGHQNPISGSEVVAILLKGWIWPFGVVALGRVCLAYLRYFSCNISNCEKICSNPRNFENKEEDFV